MSGTIALPLILVGPILRRASKEQVAIWLATSEPVKATGDIFDLSRTPDLRKIGTGDSEQIRLGDRLFVHLISATPDDQTFPPDELLGYDIELSRDHGSQPRVRLADLGLLDGGSSISYDPLPLPSFFLREHVESLNVMHASCRLLHGKGEDAFSAGDEHVRRHALDVQKRPSAQFLTGDQIYGDDVAGPIIGHIRRLATELIGPRDEISVPGTPPLSHVPIYGRKDLATGEAMFTSHKATNHLMSFGEFAAMYLIAWNHDMWPEALSGSDDVLDKQGMAGVSIRGRRKWTTEVTNLNAARRALPAVRRLLANVPTYMIFDDHDVTDDWNLSAAWRDKVKSSVTGRRVVANALAAFWAFQGWGNDPEAYDDGFKHAIARYLADDQDADGDIYDETLWSFDRWSFLAPTNPPTLVMDTRTQRSYDSPEGAARLLGAHGRMRLRELARKATSAEGRPLMVVSPVPVCGLELQERRQKYLAAHLEPYEIDFEAWHSNLRGFVDLLHFLVDELELRCCVFLSGDIHYGCNARATLSVSDKELLLAQVVSSGLKHAGPVSRAALDLLGHLVRQEHERVGWDRPPKVGRASRIKKRMMRRAVDTDEWARDAPVFLSPTAAQHLGVEERPKYVERRVYVAPSDGRRSMLLGENNIGVVSLRNDEVAHCLLSRGRKGTSHHEASIKLV